MHYITGTDRNQLQLYTSLEDSISPENAVRLIDKLVDLLYQKDPAQYIYKGQSLRGRKSYHPTLFLKLYLYGYLNRISSSRRLETETYRNIELKWLMCDLHPDFKTISDYRKDNGNAIREMTLGFRNFLKKEGYIEGNKIIFDGTKVKACTSKEKIWTDTIIASRITHMEELLDGYLSKLEENDQTEDSSMELSVSMAEMSKKIELLNQEIEKLKSIQAQLKEKSKNTYCVTDPQARLLPSRDGYIPGYNVQVGVDGKNQMIVLDEVTYDGNDSNALEENFTKIQEQMEIVPEIVEADRGYGNIAQIAHIESNGKTQCAIPLAESRSQTHNRKNGVSFTYNESEDTYICSWGRKLRRKQRTAKHGDTVFYIYQASKDYCLRCPLFGKCTRSKQGRTLKVSEHESYRRDHIQRMESDQMKELIRERKSQIEHVFGTVKRWMGKVPLLLRSRKKVQIEIDLYTTAYNIKRLCSLSSIPYLLSRIANSLSELNKSLFHSLISTFIVLNSLFGAISLFKKQRGCVLI